MIALGSRGYWLYYAGWVENAVFNDTLNNSDVFNLQNLINLFIPNFQHPDLDFGIYIYIPFSFNYWSRYQVLNQKPRFENPQKRAKKQGIGGEGGRGGGISHNL